MQRVALMVMMLHRSHHRPGGGVSVACPVPSQARHCRSMTPVPARSRRSSAVGSVRPVPRHMLQRLDAWSPITVRHGAMSRSCCFGVTRSRTKVARAAFRAAFRAAAPAASRAASQAASRAAAPSGVPKLRPERRPKLRPKLRPELRPERRPKLRPSCAQLSQLVSGERASPIDDRGYLRPLRAERRRASISAMTRHCHDCSSARQRARVGASTRQRGWAPRQRGGTASACPCTR